MCPVSAVPWALELDGKHMLGNLVSRVLFRLLREMERLNRRCSLHGDHPFFDPSEFAWTRQLALHTEVIQKELDALLPQVERLPNFQDISTDQYQITDDDRSGAPTVGAPLSARPGRPSSNASVAVQPW